MELLLEKYERMIGIKDLRVRMLIHNACNMAMGHMAQVGGHVRGVWAVGLN